LGYDFYIGWKKDEFIGKDALGKMKGGTNRKKVTFEWNAEDVVKVIASAFKPGELPYKWIDLPHQGVCIDQSQHGVR
jgi:vanillate/3-O-methylgallate O-demethylase